MKVKSLLAILLLSSACSKKAAPVDVLRMRLPTEPPSIDWNLATDNVSREVIVNLQEGLMSYDDQGNLKTSLAESFTVSPDGKTYTFKLRSNVLWSDGQPLVAQHFVDSWERLITPKTASEYAYFLFDLVGAEAYSKGTLTDFSKVGIKAADEHTLVASLTGPKAYWKHIPSFWVTYPLRKDLLAKFGDKWTEPANLVTVGPYILKRMERDSLIELNLNPKYYDQTTKRIPTILFRIVKDDSTAISLFNNKDLDIVRDLPPIQVASLAKKSEFVSMPFLRGYYIGFNVKDPNVMDAKIRRALAHSIDRGEFKTILGAMVTPSKAWNQPGLVGYSSEIGLDYNPELAKKLWSEVKNAPKVLEFMFDQKEMNKLVAENLQSQWKKVLGVQVNLSNQEWKVYLKALSAKASAIFRLGWGADYPDPDNFMNLFTCSSGNNRGNYCKKNYDDLITKAGTSFDDSERAANYQKAEKILLEEDVGILPLFNQTNMFLVSPRIKNFKVNSMGEIGYEYLQFATQQ